MVWVHSLMAGVDKLIPLVKELSRSVPMTNAKGAFSSSLAEYILASILYFNKQIPRLEQNRKSVTWEKFTMQTVRGKTVGFLGYGNIAKTVVPLCRGLGIDVCAVKRVVSGSDVEELNAQVWSSGNPEGVRTFLSKCDYVVCSLPSTSETKHFCDAIFFGLMKKSSVFISVGRGDVVDESALAAALSMGTIHGAALDVFETEPLPSDSPLWGFANCLISSHNADWIETYFEDSVDIFFANLERFLGNKPLKNIVDRDSGY